MEGLISTPLAKQLIAGGIFFVAGNAVFTTPITGNTISE